MRAKPLATFPHNLHQNIMISSGREMNPVAMAIINLWKEIDWAED